MNQGMRCEPFDPCDAHFDHDVLAAAVEASDAIVFATDTSGNILRFNPAAERLSGWSAQEIIGRHVSALWPEGTVVAAGQDLAAIIEAGDFLRMEAQWADQAGDPRSILFAVTLRRDDEGEPAYLVVSGVDVTDQRTAVAALESSERRHRALVEHASDVVVVIDAEGGVRYLGPSGERVLGWRPEEVEGTSGFDLVPAGDRPRVLQYLRETLGEPGPTSPRQFHVVDRRGHPVLFEAVANNQLHDPAVGGIILHLRDVSERQALEDSARLAEERFRQAFEMAPNGIALVDLDGTIAEANDAFAALLGRDVDEVLGSTFQELTHPDDLDADLDYLRRLLAGQIREYRMEKRYLRPDGAVVWALLNVSLLHDAEGRPDQFLSHVEDITARKSHTEELAHLAHHDGLTGLANRTAVHRRLDEALARRHLHDVGVLFLDLDGFKAINDQHGHDVGDAVLADVGRRLENVLRPTDLVGRVGGDEFVIVAEPGTDSALHTIAERVELALAAPIEVEGCPPLHVAATVGAILAEDDESTVDVLRRADEAMYRRKPTTEAVAVR
jgi:diguanylate cyclase (GGDEF)-like protein/PAS domain S-box-containing protein